MNKLFLGTVFFMVSNVICAQQLRLNEKNVDQILKAMTLEEKAQLLVGVSQNLVNGAAGAVAGFPQYGIPSDILADGPAG